MKTKITTFITILLVALIVSQQRTFAQSMALSPTPEPVDYTLPYPGLLPDNPLYPLKIFRDDFIAFVISNPVKKAQFDLLESDKHFQAGYLLIVNEHKTSLAITTISKGNNYFDEALSKVADAKKQGMDIRDLAQLLSLANRKHSEIIADFLPSMHGSEKQDLNQELLRTKDFQLRVKSFIKP